MRRCAMTLAVMLLLAVSVGYAVADETELGDLAITDAWARATIGHGKTGAVYLTIANRGDQADRLIGVETPVAARAMLHTTLTEGGVMKMRPLAAIEIPGKGRATLEPGTSHVMLMGLNRALEEGGHFIVTLDFERAGRVEVPVRVEGATAMQPMPHGGMKQGRGGQPHGTRTQ